MMTSPARNHLATVAKDEKQGFRTSNELEISHVRRVWYADYEKSDPETWWLTFGDSLWVTKYKKVYWWLTFESPIWKLYEVLSHQTNKFAHAHKKRLTSSSMDSSVVLVWWSRTQNHEMSTSGSLPHHRIWSLQAWKYQSNKKNSFQGPPAVQIW